MGRGGGVVGVKFASSKTKSLIIIFLLCIHVLLVFDFYQNWIRQLLKKKNRKLFGEISTVKMKIFAENYVDHKKIMFGRIADILVMTEDFLVFFFN